MVFQTLLKQAKLPLLRFHDLRHTTASLLRRMKVGSKLVEELLAYTHIDLMLGTYSHILLFTELRGITLVTAGLAACFVVRTNLSHTGKHQANVPVRHSNTWYDIVGTTH